MVSVSPRAPVLTGAFSCGGMIWDEEGGGLTGQSMGPLVDTATITTVMSANRVTRGGLAHDAVRSNVYTRAQTLFGYIVSDYLYSCTLPCPQHSRPVQASWLVFHSVPHGLQELVRVIVCFGSRREKVLINSNGDFQRSHKGQQR